VNYFAHGRAFVDQPSFLAGTALPDWLSVVDRRVRLRAGAIDPWCEHSDERLAALARGVAQHHRDDRRFHASPTFALLSGQIAVNVRRALPGDDSLRPWFLGHVLVELLLDAALIAAEPQRLDAYYRAMESLDADWVEWAVAQLGPRPAVGLGFFVRGFCRERFLPDYLDDAKLLWRLGQVLRRVGLSPLPEGFVDLLPAAREAVRANAEQLLAAPHPHAGPPSVGAAGA
jgi:hypothetical protein